MIPSRIQFTGFGRTPRGVRNRMVSERTPHEEGGSANRLRRRTRATPCESEVFEGSNVDERDGSATNLRGMLARTCSPTRNTSDSRGNSGRERTGPGHGTERRLTAKMGRTRMRRYANVEQTVMQGIIEARSDPGAARFACGGKNRHEGDLEGEQGPGRVGQRVSATVLDGTDPPAEQSLEGPGPFDTTTTVRLETGSSGRSRIEDDEKSEEATTTETWNGCRRGESSGGYELRCGEPRVRVNSNRRRQR